MTDPSNDESMEVLKKEIALRELSRPLWLTKLGAGATESEVSAEEVRRAAEDIEADPGLSHNGWTPKKLAAYYKSRGVGTSKSGVPDFTPVRRHRKPTRTNSKYNPHRWRVGR